MRVSKIFFYLLFVFAVVKGQSEEVRFIIFGDSQFGNPPEYERMMHEAEMLNPNFVIQVGDLIHGYTKNKEKLYKEWRWFKHQISPLTCPYYPVPGNHDVVTDEAEEVYAEVWGKEKLYYSFDKENVHSIVLNSWWQDADDRIEDWQKDWLKNDLADFAKKNGGLGSEQLKNAAIFVYMHSPLWKYPDEHEGKKDWNKVHDILKEYPVKLVVAGHSHEYVWEKKDNINYLVINSAGVSRPSKEGGKFSSFLHVSVKENGSVKYANISAGSVLPLDSVSPTERKSVPRFYIREQTIQVPNWKAGDKVDIEIEAPIINNLDTARTFRLDWFIPYGANVNITPESIWLDIDAKDTVNQIFKISSEAAPEKNNLPYLEISSKEILRTGYVSRNLEEKYKNEKQNNDIEFKSNVILEKAVEFKGKYNLFIPPIIKAKRITEKIELDGKVDEAAWEISETISKFKNSESDSVEIGMSVKILYDDNYLYVGAYLEEPNIDGLRTEAGGNIPLTWDDDDFEMFFDPAQSQSDYYRLFQNAAGTRFNSLPRWHPDKYFESKYRSKIFIGEEYWSLEMIIPWSDISLKEGPKSGDKWGFNVGRHRQQSYIKRSNWSGSLYNPKTYGVLLFD